MTLGRTARTMPVPAHLSAFWDAFVKSTGGIDEARFYEAFFFGDSERTDTISGTGHPTDCR